MENSTRQSPGGPQSARENKIAELIEETHRVTTAHERLQSLMTASSVVVEDLDLEHVLRHIVETAVSLVNAEYGALGIVDGDNRLERFIHVGISECVAAQIGSLPEGHGLLGPAIYRNGPIRLDEPGADPRSVGFPAHHPPMSAFLGVPIRIQEKAYGNLYLANGAGGSFTPEDEELVIALAATAASAINNARLYQDVKRAQQMSATLSDVSGTLLASAGKDAFGVLADHLGALLDADVFSVVVPGPVEGEFFAEAARGVLGARVQGTVLPTVVPGRSNGARLKETSSPVSSGRCPFEGPLVGGSTIAVPLVISGEEVGYLCATRIENGPSFTSADLETVVEFAQQAGTTVSLALARADRQRLDLIEDRARTARDLHDHVIQRLFGTGLGLQAFALTEPAHAEVIEKHIVQIDAAIVDIRTAIFTLNIEDSLESARHRLLDLIAEMAPILAYSPRISFVGPVDLVVVGKLADDVIAVVRESLTNVARHAQAHSAIVRVEVTGAKVTIQIVDDGVGISAQAKRASGTVNLGTRATARGGQFSFKNRRSGGTRACWQVPLPPVLEVQK